MQILYEGIFFDDKNSNIIRSLDINKLNNKINNLHLTFKFTPKEDELFNELLRKKYTIEIIGYGNDGNNAGVQVKLPDELIEYYINNDYTPHITTSISDNSKAINTHKLKFIKLDKPIKVEGTFAYYVQDNNKNYISTEEKQYERSNIYSKRNK